MGASPRLEYRRRLRRQLVATPLVALALPVSGMLITNNSPEAVAAGVGLLAVILGGGFAFTWQNWRCPVCNAMLPRWPLRLSACQRCRASFT
jgi:hypothetical protein